MSDEELDVTEVVLRDGWAVGNPITKIDMEFLASAADAITALRAQRDAANARADRAEAALAAQIEADAGIADRFHQRAIEWAKSVRGLEKHIGETDNSRIAAAIRAQPHYRTALDRMLRAEREKSLRDAAMKATSFLVGDPLNGIPLRNPMAHEVADAILALIYKEGA